MRGVGISALAGAVLAGAMTVMEREVPAFAARPTPTFERAVEYDGLGRKVKPRAHPKHNANRRTKAWRDYAAKVLSTHRVLPDGSWQEDPRDEKYLHSHARGFRGLRQALAA